MFCVLRVASIQRGHLFKKNYLHKIPCELAASLELEGDEPTTYCTVVGPGWELKIIYLVSLAKKWCCLSKVTEVEVELMGLLRNWTQRMWEKEERMGGDPWTPACTFSDYCCHLLRWEGERQSCRDKWIMAVLRRLTVGEAWGFPTLYIVVVPQSSHEKARPSGCPNLSLKETKEPGLGV